MARQVLPIVGAVAGFAVGGPTGAQIGFALGSLVGNAVDPIEMQGRKLGDAPTQVAAEGGARAIVYGKGCIRATVVIERGGRRVIKQRDRSGGKGGGPTTINERALWTFAIGLGEPVAAILRIWENEKLVYDVTPTSTIQSDTTSFAERFRFYDGSETQLPDPALEALHGAGNAPYYRGTAYMVFPQYDLTDFGETVPTYRVEVAASVVNLQTQALLLMGDDLGGRFGVPSPDGIDWSEPEYAPGVMPASIQNLLSGPDRFIATVTGGAVNPKWSDDHGLTWNDSASPFVVPRGIGVHVPGEDFGTYYIPSDQGLLYSVDGGENWSLVAEPGSGRAALGHSGLVMFNGGSGPGSLNLKILSGSSFVEGATVGLTNGIICHATDGVVVRFGGDSGGVPAMFSTTSGLTKSAVSLPALAGASITALAFGEVDEQEVWIAGTSAGEVLFDHGTGFELALWSATGRIVSAAFNGQGFTLIADDTSDVRAYFTADGTDGDLLHTFANRNGLSLGMYAGTVVSTGEPVGLGTAIAALHERCGHSASDYDVSELVELIDGLTIEQTMTGAEAVNSIIGAHFADPSDYDGQIHYIKRGKPVTLTLTKDDLVDEPDRSQRNSAIEYPKKVHFLGQRADLAYASSKATSARYSDDVRVVGEITMGSPETYSDPSAPAEVAVKLHKVLWTEAEGEREWIITDKYIGLVPTDAVGLSYRGELVRCRVIEVEDSPGQRKLRMIRDRQSAYTANLTEIPTPPSPTPPQSSVVAPTIMAFIDTSALTDNADTLHYLVALSGANENWAGAVLQQQLGGNFSTIDSTTLNSIMGALQNTVPDASPYYTDTTNTVVVRLFTDDQLESVSQSEFLSNGGAFFLSWESSGQTHWEIMQFRDAVQDSNGDWVLSHLMRGRKNTETAGHLPGANFVFIDPAILREPAQTAWIGTTLTHRAVSNGQSPELAEIQDNEYVGNSQREWPVAALILSRPDPNTVNAEAIPRHRFGSSMNPIRSVNWDGYRWSATDGVSTISRDGTSATESFDTTGWGSPVTVTVAQLNRLTGAGPSVSEEIV